MANTVAICSVCLIPSIERPRALRMTVLAPSANSLRRRMSPHAAQALAAPLACGRSLLRGEPAPGGEVARAGELQATANGGHNGMQIEDGESFDVAIRSSDVSDLIQQGRIAPGARVVLGRTGI